MQLIPQGYYDLTKYSDNFTLTKMALEVYFANNLFKADLSRVIYASEEYAFQQRINLLSKNGNPSISELNLPFMRFYRQTNWQIDDRPAVQNATAALLGFSDPSIGYQSLKFLQCQAIFECSLYFNRDADAQMAYETLTWIQHPTPQQFNYGYINYKGYAIQMPFRFHVQDIQWMPSYKETDFLLHAHIIPISFTVEVRTAVMSQSPQTPDSSVFWDDPDPVIAQQVYLDFLAYKFENSFYDQSNYGLEVAGVFTADPLLEGTVSTSNATTTTMLVSWTYNSLVAPNYTNNSVIINVNGVQNYTVPMTQLSYELTGLTANSTYNITIWFTSDAGEVTKYITTGSTIADSTMPTIPGIVGYT